MSPMSIYIVLIQQLEKHFYKQLSMFPVPATLAQNQKSLLISFIWFVWDGRSASFRGIYNSRLVCHSSFFLFFFPSEDLNASCRLSLGLSCPVFSDTNTVRLDCRVWPAAHAACSHLSLLLSVLSLSLAWNKNKRRSEPLFLVSRPAGGQLQKKECKWKSQIQ